MRFEEIYKTRTACGLTVEDTARSLGLADKRIGKIVHNMY